MTREKRKMVRILDPELFEKNKTALLRLERQRGRDHGGGQTVSKRLASSGHHGPHLQRSMGAGGDLYIASQKNACNG